MSFPQLDNTKGGFPGLPANLKGLLPELDKYLNRQLTRKTEEAEPVRDIVPGMLASKLKIDEGLALALLMVYENAGVVKPRYHVLCPETSAFLQEFTSPKLLPKKIDCPYHDPEKEHRKSDYYVDLVFRFTPQVLKKYIAPRKTRRRKVRRSTK